MNQRCKNSAELYRNASYNQAMPLQQEEIHNDKILID
jgi:hypothetical protein